MEGGDCVVHPWGQLIFYRRLKSPLLLTRPKALVRSTKAMYSGCYCSLQFSCSLRSVKITSTVDLPALKLQASQDESCEDIAHDAQGRNTGIAVVIAAITLILVEGHNVVVAHVVWDVSLFPSRRMGANLGVAVMLVSHSSGHQVECRLSQVPFCK